MSIQAMLFVVLLQVIFLNRLKTPSSCMPKSATLISATKLHKHRQLTSTPI